jgi:NADPH:quinone reductase-like Zn-dependent oxidoreductase
VSVSRFFDTLRICISVQFISTNFLTIPPITMPITREAYRVSKAGALTNMRLTSETIPDPAANEVIIEVRSIGLNFADIFAIMGLYSATPKGSFVPGLEYAGVVAAVGNAVSRVAVGQRVMGVVRFGAYTSHVTIDENYVMPLADDWSFEEGAAFLIPAITAYYALVPLGALRRGGAVLIHSAAGGVGIVANRIAKAFNAFTIGTVGSESKVELLKREGYDQVIVRSGNTFKDMMQPLRKALTNPDGTKRPLSLVLDSIGGNVLKASYHALAPAGRVVCFGSANMAFQGKKPPYLSLLWKFLQRPKFDPLAMIDKNKAIMGFNLIWLWEDIAELHKTIQAVQDLQLPKPLVGHTFRFDELPKAIETFQSGMTVGKVVVNVG